MTYIQGTYVCLTYLSHPSESAEPTERQLLVPPTATASTVSFYSSNKLTFNFNSLTFWRTVVVLLLVVLSMSTTIVLVTTSSTTT
jgi:hypothetical protein